MNEAHLEVLHTQAAQLAAPTPAGDGDEDALQPLGWSDIVARTTAHRQLYRAMLSSIPTGGSRFADLFSGKPEINLGALGNGKRPVSMGSQQSAGTQHGSRGMR